MKKTIRITESDLHRIVKESVQKVINEVEGQFFGLTKIQGKELWDAIDKHLQQLGDVYVSKFYSDENQITVAANRNIGREEKKEVIEIMKNFGYNYYTSGANDEFIMMTFRPM